MKKNYFTIGEVAKMSGVNAKSLRYYERIGVLTPIYIDPHTSYRYYTQKQLDVIAMIQLCIELDVPLKMLHQFSSSDGQRLDMDQLLAYSKTQAVKKMSRLQASLEFIQSYQADIAQNQQFLATPQTHVNEVMANKRYYCHKLMNFPTISEYWQTYQQLVIAGQALGILLSYEAGILIRQGEQALEYYQYIEMSTQIAMQAGKSFEVQAGQYPVRKFGEATLSSTLIANVFQDFPPHTAIVATELVHGEFDSQNMSFKFRFVPEAQIDSQL